MDDGILMIGDEERDGHVVRCVERICSPRQVEGLLPLALDPTWSNSQFPFPRMNVTIELYLCLINFLCMNTIMKCYYPRAPTSSLHLASVSALARFYDMIIFAFVADLIIFQFQLSFQRSKILNAVSIHVRHLRKGTTF